uniref:Si:ch211-258f14.2 n=1 Tax=Cyclopterus lumpus TaxID=8103 RepID=A0A8C3G6R5_CYCLU
MARTGSGALLSRRNIKLDSFLKRNTERAVYERIRAHEPCVVISETVNKVYMHVVLSDERVYLTEYPPRTLTEAFSFRRVRDVELVNDLPDFLHGKDRELCQHIRITYVTDKPAVRGRDWLRRDRRVGLPPAFTSSISSLFLRSPDELRTPSTARSASCPNPETLGLVGVPRSPSTAPTPVGSPTFPLPTFPDTGQVRTVFAPAVVQNTHRTSSVLTALSIQVPRGIGAVLSRLLKRDSASGGVGEEREAELHLYAVSHTSRLYLHLQSSWSSFIIRSTLSLDPLYRRKCSASWERTTHLFAQLSCELLQEGIRVESLYLLLQELRTAAHRNVALRRLFWRSSELFVFLVQTLEESLYGCQNTADQLLSVLLFRLSTLTVQTLAVMFRETEVEPARLHLLSALLFEYLDAACSLLFELLLLGHNVSSNKLNLSLPFLIVLVRQVVLVLSDLQESPLSPLQSVLLFQRCRLLLACLQYNTRLAQHLRSHFREEFRSVPPPRAPGEKLPPRYPISQPTLQLVERILTLHLHG